MIPYTYEIINVDPAAKVMEIVYSSEGRQTMHISARMPYVGESLEAVVQMYSPVAYWLEQEMAVADVQQGVSGSVIPPEAEPMTLAKARSNKLAEIAAWRYVRETSGITVGGMRINTDRESQATISGTYASMKDGLISNVDWKTADGTFVTLTLPQIAVIAQAVATHVQQSFTLEKQYAEQVQAAETIEAVMAIVPETVFAV